ncbi:MAG: TerB family tellurite resistance protein [Proteobacteria bacterium]|nr:TerB family tellurite resistance protein [Pseudomonadota bacterium]MDA0995095.1 TerB family tellurite resistance protein [Pseudomonadota bacterium]
MSGFSRPLQKAGRVELYETTPLAKYLSSVCKKLKDADRVRIVHLLAEVIRSDTSVSVLEIDFFNRVAKALKATPAEVAGLTSL